MSRCLLIACFAWIWIGASGEVVLDVFDFETTATAQEFWRPVYPSSPVGIVSGMSGQDAPGVVFPCAMTDEVQRCVWDCDIEADLSMETSIALRIYVSDPSPISYLTVYFRAPGGWYPASSSVVRGWQTLKWNREDFRVEGTPAGWDQIEGIRFSPWKAISGSTEIVATGLRAYTPPVTIVRCSSPEGEKVEDPYADMLGRLLDDLSVEYGMVDGNAVATNGVQGRLAMVTYDPAMSEAELAALESFVGYGGKLILFYSLPSRLANLLGVQYVTWKKITLGGMQFLPGLMDCGPDHVVQGSWNITVARPSTVNGAEILAYWEDPEGNRLEDAAWFIHKNGAFMSHVLLGGDLDSKRQLLMALLGRFVPDVVDASVEATVGDIGRIGPYEGFDEAVAAIRSDASLTPRSVRVEEALTSATLLRQEAQEAVGVEVFCETLRLAQDANRYLREAFYLAQRPQLPEFRSAWNHSGTGAYPGDWSASAANLAANGFNAILPNMLWGGLAHYDSALLPHSDDFTTYGDQIAQCVEACHEQGIEVHVWKVNWNLLTAPPDFVATLRSQNRTQVDVNGDPVDWLCPSDPLNYQLELDSLLEVARNYDVDGIHFDYIRYPDSTTCYCDPCRERFERDADVVVESWPLDCYTGPLRDAYREWRAAQITRLVKGVAEAVRQEKPNVKISAAVFRDYPSCKYSVGQDWLDWVQNGYLDFICPMDYLDSHLAFEGAVSVQLGLVDGRIPVYPGIGVTASSSNLEPDETITQIRVARELGTGGFVLFNYAIYLAEEQLPSLRKGTTAPDALTKVFLCR